MGQLASGTRRCDSEPVEPGRVTVSQWDRTCESELVGLGGGTVSQWV